MLYNILFYLFICVISSKVCLCERRLTNGRVVATDKKYMVYIVNSPYSDNQPDSWLCGGVLISTLHVLTAAACLTEVSHMYVIAGYKKYVSGKNIRDDPCTATRKQRIVRVIIPKAYNESTWMRFDVGVGVVEKHYDFLDESYHKDCSYSPEPITINYYMALESPDATVLALGWGTGQPRTPGMPTVNSEYLMETHAIIGNTSFCQLQFPKKLEYLFLCTYGSRDIDILRTKAKKEKEMTSASTTKKTTRHMVPSTTTKTRLTNTETPRFTPGTWRCGADMHFSPNTPPDECLDMISEVQILRRKALVLNGSDTPSDEISNKNETFKGNKSDSNLTISRRQGTDVENYGSICQNDHGGPLVALAGQQERLIGIALNSVYNKNNQCDGPSLYISTARAKALISCLLASKNEKYYVPKRCKAMNFEVRKYNVSWPDCNEGDCETTTWVPPPNPSIQPVSVPPVQPQYNMGLPPLNTPPNLMMELPHTPSHTFPHTPYHTLTHIPPNHHIPPQYPYYSPENYKMPYHYAYFSHPTYNLGLQYKLQNYHMGMPHIPSNLKIGQTYNPSNYFKVFPYNLQNYNMDKKPPYARS